MINTEQDGSSILPISTNLFFNQNQKTMTVEITVKDCDLQVTGYYSKEEPDVGFRASFEISEIYCNDDISNLLGYPGLLSEIEEKCLEIIENDEHDYED